MNGGSVSRRRRTSGRPASAARALTAAVGLTLVASAALAPVASAGNPPHAAAPPAATSTARVSASGHATLSRHPAATAPAGFASGAIVREGAPRPTTGAISAVIVLATTTGTSAALGALAAKPASMSRAQALSALSGLTPTEHARDTVLAWARSLGLGVDMAGRWQVEVSGGADAMSAAFGTALLPAPAAGVIAGNLSLRPYLRPAHTPAVPRALVGAASAVVGLDSRPLYAPLTAAGSVGTHQGAAAFAATQGARSSPQFVLGDAGYTGDQVRDAYAAPRDAAAGAGLTVGTVQFSGFNSQDIVDYAYQGDIPLFGGQVSLVSVDGTDPTVAVNGGDAEVALDSEALLAVAPMARQRVYFAQNTLAGTLAAYGRLADDAEAGLVQAVSTSWGHCESGASSAEQVTVRQDIQRMVAAGVTVTAASGDSGSADCTGSAGAAVDFPASIPEVVATGGTTLPNGTGVAAAGYQSGWTGSGGGTSTLYSKPSYQGALAGTMRSVPDVALEADPNTPFAFVHNGYFGSVGGTSLAAPMFAGLLVSALSEADSTNGLGDIHTALYAAGPAAFQDVVSGSNGAFSAGTGYDQVTGLGAPRMGALAEALGIPAVARAMYHPIDPVRIADTRTGLGVPAGRLAAGQTITVTVQGATAAVPSTGVTAAAVTVTAISPSGATYLSVYPTGGANGSATSALNAVPGAPTPNLVISKVDSQGRLSVYNAGGTVDVAVDLDGYFARDAAAGFTPLTPARAVDTRSGRGVRAGKVGPGGTITVKVAGTLGVPSSGAAAVVLNVTAVNASQTTYVSAYPTGFTGGPSTSNLNVPVGRAVADLVISKVSAAGDVSFYNRGGSVDVIADVIGYYGAGGLGLQPVAPVRVLDTRGSGALGAQAAGDFSVAANGSRIGAVVTNLTGTGPTTATFLSLFPVSVTATVGRTSSTLNLYPGQTRANLATTAVSAAAPPRERVYNNSGVVNVIADVSGYFSGQPTQLPQTSVTASGPATPAAYGAAVTLTASATSTGGAVAALAPGATVSFVEPGVGAIGHAVVAGNGSAALTSNALPAGSDTIVAVVDAHDGIAGSQSAPVTVTVNPPPASSTTLVASTVTTPWDSPVTLTATVSYLGSPPPGVVTFIDADYGTQLGRVALSSGVAQLTTAALAAGSRHLEAVYTSAGGPPGSTSAPLTIAVDQPSPSAYTTFQADRLHDGLVAGDAITKNLTLAWSANLGTLAGEPLIAGGRVFIAVQNPGGVYGTQLYALDRATGAVLWGPVAAAGTYWSANMAYDGQRLFDINFDGLVRTFDAATGAPGWSRQLSQYAFTAPPTAWDGVLYAGGSGGGGTLYAMSESDGSLLWSVGVTNGDDSAPVVDPSGVFVSYACQLTQAFSLTGTSLWLDQSGCEGGGGQTAPLHQGRLYVPSNYPNPPPIIDAATGAVVGTYQGGTIAFDSTQGYQLVGSTLSNLTPVGTTTWSFAGDGQLQGWPIVDNGLVFIASGSGKVFAVSAATGLQQWAVTVPGTAGSGQTMALAENTLVVEQGDVVSAYS
jgi:outer membrane protein assembly factor BamB